MIKNDSTLKWLWVAAVVFVLDQLTKHWVSANWQLGELVPVIDSFFNFTLVHNYGAAFGFLADQPGWQRWFFTIVAIVVSFVLIQWMRTLEKKDWQDAVALSLIIGGAWGNVYDRLIHGYVVDFFDFRFFGWAYPAFNIADAGICVGAGILLWRSFQEPNKVKNDETPTTTKVDQ